jgi:hypothetical protein
MKTVWRKRKIDVYYFIHIEQRLKPLTDKGPSVVVVRRKMELQGCGFGFTIGGRLLHFTTITDQ